ncbi:YybH family protein [Flavobacteriaceae bacterium LMO-SS05]
MKNFFFLIVFFLAFWSCEPKNAKDLTDKWKQEILESEENFVAMLNDKGLHEAFVAYAANDAVIMRNNKVYIGKEAIDEHYKAVHTTTMVWTPDFVDVSKSGDLGYTYGTYHYTYTDSLGNKQVDTGIFHTVWKRQLDGTWKFVWD